MQFVHKFHDYRLQIHRGYEEYRQGAGGVSISVATSPALEAIFKRRPLPIRGDFGEISAETAAFVWRELARQFFDGRDIGVFGREQFGAYRHDGVTTATDGEGDNVFFSGSQREQFYGVFDTEDIDDCEPQYRDIYEAVLAGDEAACATLSKERGYLGRDALRISPDLRSGEMVILDKLLAGGYGEFIVQTPEGPFVTGLGLARATHTAVGAPAPAATPAAFPVHFPWKGYDDITGNHLQVAKTIAETAVVINLDIPKVLAYELEHKGRKSVIKRLTDLVNEAAAQTPPLAPEPEANADGEGDDADELAAKMQVAVPS